MTDLSWMSVLACAGCVVVGFGLIILALFVLFRSATKEDD